MKIAIGCDHGGFVLKGQLIKYLEQNNNQFKDCGTYNTDSCDYPDYAEKVAQAVLHEGFDRGILICSTGIGISIAANKIKGIRCALCHDVYSAKYTRYHNDANVLAMGAKIIGEGLMTEIVSAFLNSEFEGGRHQRRVDKITKIEESNL